MRKLLIWLPLGMFLIFLVVFAGGLISPESKTIPSKLIEKDFEQALGKALKLADDAKAAYLPGWAGIQSRIEA